MPTIPPDGVRTLVDAGRDVLGRLKQHAVLVPPNPIEVVDAERTLGQRVADGVARTAGSWSFILSFLSLLCAWMVVNLVAQAGAFDPFPFILLNLVLSCVAALQAPIIMMSQNRQAIRDRRHAELDYQVNVRAEKEVAQLKTELETLRHEQWAMLVNLQHEQLELLRNLTAPAAPAPPRAEA